MEIDPEKSTNIIEIPICNKARKILEKYKFDLPKKSNAKQNKYLKDLGKLVGLNEKERVIYFYGKETKLKIYSDMKC